MCGIIALLYIEGGKEPASTWRSRALLGRQIRAPDSNFNPRICSSGEGLRRLSSKY